jgi:hypothetical protein
VAGTALLTGDGRAKRWWALQASLFLESTSGGKLPEDIGLHARGITTPRD